MINLFTFRKENLDEKKAMRFDYSSVFTDDKGYIYCAKCSTKWLKKYYNTHRHYRKLHLDDPMNI